MWCDGLNGHELHTLRRISAGLPAFNSFTQNRAILAARNRILNSLFEQGLIERTRKGLRLTEDAEAIFAAKSDRPDAWQPYEDELIQTQYANLGPGPISGRLGRTRAAVVMRAERIGAPLFHKRKQSPRAGIANGLRSDRNRKSRLYRYVISRRVGVRYGRRGSAGIVEAVSLDAAQAERIESLR